MAHLSATGRNLGLHDPYRVHDTTRAAGTVGKKGSTPQAGAFLARGGASVGDNVPPAAWGGNRSRPAADLTGVSHDSELELRDTEGKKYHIPGYTGFVPNVKDVAGRGYTKTTKRALNKDVWQIVTGDIIPSEPQATHKRYVHDDAMDRTVIGQNNAVPKQISGYSGFVPQIRDAALGETFASHCAKVMNRHMDAKNDRRALNAKPVGGFAFSGTTTKPKAKLVVKDVGLNLTYTAQ